MDKLIIIFIIIEQTHDWRLVWLQGSAEILVPWSSIGRRSSDQTEHMRPVVVSILHLMERLTAFAKNAILTTWTAFNTCALTIRCPNNNARTRQEDIRPDQHPAWFTRRVDLNLSGLANPQHQPSRPSVVLIWKSRDQRPGYPLPRKLRLLQLRKSDILAS